MNIPHHRVFEALRAVPRASFVSSQDLEPSLSGHSIPSRGTLEHILKALPPFAASSRVLHIGTGAGYVAAVLAKLFADVVSVDRNPSMVALARQRVSGLGLDNLSFVVGDAEGPLGLDGDFDVVLVTTFLSSMDPLVPLVREGGSLIHLAALPENPPMLVHDRKREGGLKWQGSLCQVDFRRSTEDALIDLGLLPEGESGAPRTEGAEALGRALANPAVSEREVYRKLASARRDLSLAELDALLPQVDPALFSRFSRSFLEHHRLIPLYQEGQRLYVASDNPDAGLDAIDHLTESKLTLLLVTPTDFRRLWSQLTLSERSQEPSPAALSRADRETETALEAGREGVVSPYLVSLYEGILLEAVSQQASDIHIERYGKRVRVRLRIDGELHDLDQFRITPAQLLGVVNVIKLRAELNIAERRLPQGGRSRLKMGDASFDLRGQTQPSLHGEHVVIRLLRQTGRAMTMQELGMSAKLAGRYQRLLDNPAGLVLVVGPTGSGKSTTLYAGLQELADDGRRKVITVEDPIEYSIDNIQQTRVRPDIGFSFADAMRSFVRQDPDVILVGEVRDQETALEAIRASQTGHVVLSTLHCNDSVDALQRLYDLGVHPNSIASELLSVIAQRLAKRICPDCRQPATPDPAVMAELFPDGPPGDFRCFEGAGCPQCKGRGTRGRIAVVEFLQVNRDIRNGISLQLPVGDMRRLALDAGLITMRDSALDHVIQGIIPLSELPRILPEDRMAPEKRGGRG